MAATTTPVPDITVNSNCFRTVTASVTVLHEKEFCSASFL